MTIGLRDLFYATVEEDASGHEVYGKPERLAKAIKVDLSVEKAEATLYADDAVDATFSEFIKGKITLNVNDLEPGKESVLLGQIVDDDGVVYAGGDDEPPTVAIGFRAKKGKGGKYRYLWLYSVKFTIPNQNYQTRGEAIAIQTPEITGEFIKRQSDGNWKADYVGKPDDKVAKDWFTKVREPKPATGGAGGSGAP
jgi:phi13 family phage major tail protein